MKSQKLGRWSEEEDEKFITLGKEIMEREKITEPTKFTYWTELSQKMGTRTYRECARHWTLLGPKLKRERLKWSYHDFKSLLLKMIGSFACANDESETIWSSIINANDKYSREDVRKKWVFLKNKLAEKFDLDDYTFKGTHFYRRDPISLRQLG